MWLNLPIRIDIEWNVKLWNTTKDHIIFGSILWQRTCHPWTPNVLLSDSDNWATVMSVEMASRESTRNHSCVCNWVLHQRSYWDPNPMDSEYIPPFSGIATFDTQNQNFLFQSALFNFQSLLTVVLLLICTCAYLRSLAPRMLNKNKEGCVNHFVVGKVCRLL